MWVDGVSPGLGPKQVATRGRQVTPSGSFSSPPYPGRRLWLQELHKQLGLKPRTIRPPLRIIIFTTISDICITSYTRYFHCSFTNPQEGRLMSDPWSSAN